MSSQCRWLLEHSPALIAVLDQSLECRELSAEWLDRLGIVDAGTPGLSLDRLVDLESNPDLPRRLRAVLDGAEAIHDYRVVLPCEDGRTSGRLSAWHTQLDPDGESRLIVIVTDTSELDGAMRDLMRVQTQQQIILSAAGEGIYGLDGAGNLTFGNSATYEILGWSVKDILGKKAHDVHHHSHPDGTAYPREECPIYAALRDGEVHRVDDEVFWHTNGEPVPVEYTSTPILKDGKPNGAVVVFRDISRRKEIEQQREAAFAEIKALKEELEQERDYLRDEVRITVSFGEIIGESVALKRTLAKVEAVAGTTANVLILGESGVGKEMIARAIHTNSPRADRPLVRVNCASIPKDLFESEFFGHVKGAFTGAHKDRVGRLQLANGGTLFLDEVGEIPLPLQSKLLRSLQEQEFERVGDDKTTTVDVRVVAATNRDLEEEVAAGRFREDLYYRLSVFPIELPPLRDRIDDVVPLATHFLGQVCAELGRDRLLLAQQHMMMLRKHAWPGNIRELKNVIERAVILTTGERLRLDLAMGAVDQAPVARAIETATGPEFLTEAEFREKEKENLIAALHAAKWRVWGADGAAALLGIKPSTLSYRMNALGIEKGEQR
jgi:PAS domain S-box-containing protein